MSNKSLPYHTTIYTFLLAVIKVTAHVQTNNVYTLVFLGTIVSYKLINN